MKILVACEYSATVRDAFRAKGHDAWSCDILPTEGDPRWHIVGNAASILSGNGWDMLIAHPPCTYLSNSGVCWLYNKDKTKNGDRWEKMKKAATFFKRFLYAPIDKICVENPIQHKHCEIVKQNQIIQPWMYGHLESKATALWLKNLPLLQETINVKKEMLLLPKNIRQRLHYLPPSVYRAKLRSKTYQGIANAMADQWG